VHCLHGVRHRHGRGTAAIAANLNAQDPSYLNFSQSLTDNNRRLRGYALDFCRAARRHDQPNLFSACLRIKDEKKVNVSLLLSALMSLLSFVWAVYMGLAIRSITAGRGLRSHRLVHGQAASPSHGAVCSADFLPP
jgi:hypothetical protein